MRNTIIIFLFLNLFSISSHLYATSTNKFICSIYTYRKNRSIIDSLDPNRDKLKHCTLSCILGFNCPHLEVATIGIIKEIWDIPTPGDSSIKDLIADFIGLNISKRINSQSECLIKCDSKFPMRVYFYNPDNQILE